MNAAKCLVPSVRQRLDTRIVDKNLVDPASSHTFVLELKPCMQGDSFLSTVKGSFYKT